MRRTHSLRSSISPARRLVLCRDNPLYLSCLTRRGGHVRVNEFLIRFQCVFFSLCARFLVSSRSRSALAELLSARPLSPSLALSLFSYLPPPHLLSWTTLPSHNRYLNYSAHSASYSQRYTHVIKSEERLLGVHLLLLRDRAPISPL